MTNVQKFMADARRILKHVRANNNGRSNTERACKDVASLFIRSTSVPGDLPSSVAEYWQRTYIDTSSDFSEEPTEKNLEKLSAFLSFLENADENEDLLSDSDWRTLGELVNYEAEDLPVDVLQYLMAKIVEKGALL